MSQKNTALKTQLQRAELLEPRTVLSGAAIVQPFANVTDDTGSSRDWSLQAVDAVEAWEQGYTGEGVLIAVIDTGVDVFHKDLSHSIWVNQGEIPGNEIDDDNNGFVDDVHGWDFVDLDNDMSDLSGHGTAVAGTIVAGRNDMGSTGVAYDAEVMVVRVLDADGVGTQLDIAAGVRYAIANGADIINLSLGGTDSKRIATAIQYARTEDVLVVAAAGNAATDEPDFPARYSAEFNNVISVGAFDSSFELAEFSNTVGDTNAVQVDAPGQAVYSSVPDDFYQIVSGTSFAAPHVSGVAALALSANPDLSAAELRELIVQGTNIQIAGSDSVGALDAATTVALAAATIPPPDVVVAPDESQVDPQPVSDDLETIEDSSGETDVLVGEPPIEVVGVLDPDESATEEPTTGEATPADETDLETPRADSDTPEIGSDSNEPTGEGDAAPGSDVVEATPLSEGADAVPEITEEEAASLLAYLGDIDGDGEVGFSDFLKFTRNYGADVEPGLTGDLNRDGVVGFEDFLTLTRNFGRTLDEMYAQKEADMLAESVTDELFEQE